MFCPECRAEYIDGIIFCSVCNIRLVEKLPEAEPPLTNFVDYEEVLSTYNPADIAFLKSLLEGEGIQHFFKGEHFMYVRPMADPARLMIRKDQVEDALQLINRKM